MNAILSSIEARFLLWRWKNPGFPGFFQLKGVSKTLCKNHLEQYSVRMSTTPENPNQGEPPYQPPQQPAAGAPTGNPASQGPGTSTPQQPGYAAPQYQQPQYQQPPQQPGASNDFKFEIPADAPKSINDVMPKGGFSGIFNVSGLPMLLKISYLIWIIGAGLWLLTTIIGLIFSFALLGRKSDSILGVVVYDYTAQGIGGIVLSIVALVVIAAIVVSAMKLKEGLQWPRMALSVLAVISFILVFFGAGIGFLGVIAAVLMWLPESSAWINSQKQGAA